MRLLARGFPACLAEAWQRDCRLQQWATLGGLQHRRGFARGATRYPLPEPLADIVAVAEALKPERPLAPPLEARPLAPESRRAGVLAVKAGMTQDWDEWGARVPLTVLWVDDCQVGAVARDGGGSGCSCSYSYRCALGRGLTGPCQITELATWGRLRRSCRESDGAELLRVGQGLRVLFVKQRQARAVHGLWATHAGQCGGLGAHWWATGQGLGACGTRV
jgi:hypothetical protein